MSGTFLYPVQVLVCVKLLIKDKIGNTGTVRYRVKSQTKCSKITFCQTTQKPIPVSTVLLTVTP